MLGRGVISPALWSRGRVDRAGVMVAGPEG